MNGIQIAPNPFNPKTRITFPNPGHKADLLLYDVRGKEIFHYNDFRETAFLWDAAKRPSGIYWLRITIYQGRQKKKQFVQSLNLLR